MAFDIYQLSNAENELVKQASERFGESFFHANDLVIWLWEFIKQVTPAGLAFSIYLAQLKKTSTLALLSIVRKHETQAQLLMRTSIEAVVKSAYAMVNKNLEDYLDITKEGNTFEKRSIKIDAYRWIEMNYAERSKSLKGMKDNINLLWSHSNIIDAQSNLMQMKYERILKTEYFDNTDDWITEILLWQLANILVNAYDLYWVVNETERVAVFEDNFLQRHRGNIGRHVMIEEQIKSKPKVKEVLDRSQDSILST